MQPSVIGSPSDLARGQAAAGNSINLLAPADAGGEGAGSRRIGKGGDEAGAGPDKTGPVRSVPGPQVSHGSGRKGKGGDSPPSLPRGGAAPARGTGQRLRDLLPSPLSLPMPSSPPPSRRAKDPFGYSRRLHDQVRPLAEFFYRRYWRVETTGVENIPSSGAALVVGNHSGAIPLDAAMLVAAVDLDHPQHRLLRFLYDPFVSGMPLVGDFYSRMGSVVASYDNARVLLRRGDLVGIFPEGVEGVAKGVGRRYQVQRFRTGFVRLSLELRVPVVPVAIVGAEETYPVIGRWTAGGLFTKLLNVPYLPVTPFFPLFGVLGVIPLPTRWRVRFGEPLHLYAEPGVDRGSRRCVEALTERVRRQIQGMVHRLLAERNSVF